jgi:site-specific DNA-cytosine methylase
MVAIPVLTPDRPTKRQNGRRMKDDGEASFTITAQDRHGVMLQVNPSTESGGKQPYQQNRVYDAEGIAPANQAGLSEGSYAVKYENRIRRLTPVECARLQGFPDDWADFGSFQDKHGEWHVREISDTGKYQVFGNAVTVNVIEALIARMIEKGCL